MIPLLGALALGAQRLLPAFQQIYSGWAALKAYNAPLQAVLAMLNQPLPPHVAVTEPLVLREVIHFAGVHFRYGAEQPEVVKGWICRSAVASGLVLAAPAVVKALLLLINGPLVPTAGRLLVDGVDLHDPNILSFWRLGVRRLPMCRSIYLADSLSPKTLPLVFPEIRSIWPV